MSAPRALLQPLVAACAAAWPTHAANAARSLLLPAAAGSIGLAHEQQQPTSCDHALPSAAPDSSQTAPRHAHPLLGPPVCTPISSRSSSRSRIHGGALLGARRGSLHAHLLPPAPAHVQRRAFINLPSPQQLWHEFFSPSRAVTSYLMAASIALTALTTLDRRLWSRLVQVNHLVAQGEWWRLLTASFLHAGACGAA